MVIRNWLLVVIAGMVLLAASPAYAQDPGWHTVQVAHVTVRADGEPVVGFDPGIVAECDSPDTVIATGGHRNAAEHHRYVDGALAQLSDALSQGAPVRVYLAEQVSLEGERHCVATDVVFHTHARG